MSPKEFKAQLSDYSFLITYSPLKDEAGADAITPSGIDTYTIPADATVDPLALASELIQKAAGRKTAVFLPGTNFDASGTRHGRGGGWYDRFLNAAPREWLRVGVCAADQMSIEMLERKFWDEAMDYIAVVSSQGEVVVHTTGAR